MLKFFFFFTLFLIGPTEKPTRDFTRAAKTDVHKEAD